MDHWEKHAENWQHVGPPLRPSEEDVQIFRHWIEAIAPGRVPLRILLLGVTPELCTLALPAGAEFVAVERNAKMIEHVWPERAQGKVELGDWRDLQIPSSSIDVVLGDGCFTTLGDSADYAAVCRSLARVLKPDGRLLHRFFIRPDASETIEQILTDLRAGSIQSFDVFKWRLLMSLVDDETDSVFVSDITEALERNGGEIFEILKERGFSPAAIATLHHYRGVKKRYTFPKGSDLERWLAPFFHLEQTIQPTYELAERCPLTLWIRSC